MKQNREIIMIKVLGVAFVLFGALLAGLGISTYITINGGLYFSPFQWQNDVVVFCLVFFFVGLTFSVIGLALWWWVRRRARIKKRLIESGDRITADIDDVVLNTMVRVNFRYPYVVLCSWYDAREEVTYHFKSENLWSDPTKGLAEAGINTVTVYVNRDNMKRYYVDVPDFGKKDVHL